MKNLVKQYKAVYPLGIQITPTLWISPFSSNLEITTLGYVGNGKKLAMELCNFVPLSSSITYFDPYVCLSIKPSMMDFDRKIPNHRITWIFPYNVHHPKTMHPPY